MEGVLFIGERGGGKVKIGKGGRGKWMWMWECFTERQIDGEGGLLINDVDHTVRNEDIRLNDFCAVDKDIHPINRDGKIVAIQSLEHGPVHERGAVAYGTGVDDVVLEDARDLLGGQVGQCGSNVLERGVVGRKDGQVATHGVEGGAQALGLPD